MTAYFLLGISLLLAIFGTFYKSTVTDDKGNTLYSKGLPVLTKVGKAVLSLLLIFSLGSGYMIWDSASEAHEKEKKLEERNDRLEQELAKSLHPIRDIQTSFEISVPLDGIEMEAYRRRLEDYYKDFQDREIDGARKDLMMSPMQESEKPGRNIDEALAHMYFDRIYIEVDLYKAPANKSPSPDFRFSIRCGLEAQPSFTQLQECAGKMSLQYEVLNSRSRITVSSANLNVHPAYWLNDGRIATLSDLAGAIIVVRYVPPGVGNRRQGVQHEVEIRSMELKLSGRIFKFGAKELKRTLDPNGMTVYVSQLPQYVH